MIKDLPFGDQLMVIRNIWKCSEGTSLSPLKKVDIVYQHYICLKDEGAPEDLLEILSGKSFLNNTYQLPDNFHEFIPYNIELDLMKKVMRLPHSLRQETLLQRILLGFENFPRMFVIDIYLEKYPASKCMLYLKEKYSSEISPQSMETILDEKIQTVSLNDSPMEV